MSARSPLHILKGKHLLLGVCGSVAAYKAVDLASQLTQGGARVSVILTEAAQRFVTPLSFQSVSGQTVYSDPWRVDTGGELSHIPHINLGERADLGIIAPCTAQTIARLAGGFADNLLTLTALSLRCPLWLAPAMDGGMYEHPATQANLATLRARGVQLLEPEAGRLASGLEGRGRLPEVPTLLGHIRAALGRLDGPLRGKRILVTAGGTREPIDPVRYLGNRSSGRQGYAIGQAALDAGAELTLISTLAEQPLEGPPTPVGATLIRVETAQEMREATLAQAKDADAIVMAAAVADFQPAQPATQKIKKHGQETPLNLKLSRAPDTLAALATKRRNDSKPHLIIGFAAESEDLRRNAAAKMTSKRLDLLLANNIGATDAGFAVNTNRITLFTRAGTIEEWPLMSKAAVGERLMGEIAALLKTGKG